MTKVKELIEELQKCNPESEVYIYMQVYKQDEYYSSSDDYISVKSIDSSLTSLEAICFDEDVPKLRYD